MLNDIKNYLVVRNILIECMPCKINNTVSSEFMRVILKLMGCTNCYYILLKHEFGYVERFNGNWLNKTKIHLLAFYVYNYLLRKYLS